MQYEHLITLAARFSVHIGRSEATVSNWCAGHALLFRRLREGHGCTVTTMNRAFQWFSDHWPADLEWPADIARPAQSRKPEAA